MSKTGTNTLKGKTYEEIHGIVEAKRLCEYKRQKMLYKMQNIKKRLAAGNGSRNKPSWNKGKNLTKGHRKKISQALKGRIAWNKGKKGLQVAWNKGMKGYKTKPCSKERKQKISKANFGKVRTPEVCEKYSKAQLKLFRDNPLRYKIMQQRAVLGALNTPKKATSIEVKLWNELKKRRVRFEKNKSILKTTIPDVFIFPNICIYADGDYWHKRPEVIIRDNKINQILLQNRFKVIRLTESEIRKNNFKKLQGVL